MGRGTHRPVNIADEDQQAPKANSCTPGTSNALDPEKSDNKNNGSSLQDVLMDNWEEFDEDAVYQKKRVDPEMQQWVLTKGC